MREKNYIEKVTNLVRARVPYVSRDIADEILTKYNAEITDFLVSDYDGETLEKTLKELEEQVKSFRDALDKECVSLYKLDINNGTETVTTTKRPINICPYCGEKMKLAWTDDSYSMPSKTLYRSFSRTADSVRFRCFTCGASSPHVGLSTDMLDENVVACRIGQYIESSLDFKESEDDDE